MLPTSETPELKIDSELRDLIPPLTDDECAALKESISIEGCREPLIIWKGRNTILDGHNRYQICTELQAPFKTIEIELADLTQAKIWMIKNQKGRRNLEESQWAMLAVKLEALYTEQAKSRKGSRTDLGQNLGQGEFGRSAEKAAKDMGVSHQTVSYAKKVSKDGISGLVKLVESGKVAVSAAAKVTALPPKTQAKVVEKAEIQAREGSRPNVAAILREVIPKSARNDSDEALEKSRTDLNACLKLLENVDTTQRPENLVEMRAVVERLATKLKELEERSFDPEVKSKSNCVIRLNQFGTLIKSIASVSNVANLKFDIDGVRARASSMDSMVEGFLPSEVFSRYAELGEMGFPEVDKFLGMLSTLSNGRNSGTVNLLIYMEPGMEGNPDQLHMISGLNEIVYLLGNPSTIEGGEFPETIGTCKVRVEGEDFSKAIKQSSALSKTTKPTSGMSKDAKFLLSNGFFRIVTEDENKDKVMAKPKCDILMDGTADSTFAVDRLLAVNRVIGKSKDVILSLGMNQPMILELALNKTTIKYYLKQKEQEKGCQS